MGVPTSRYIPDNTHQRKGEEVNSDGAIVLLEKLERKLRVSDYLSVRFYRKTGLPLGTDHSNENLMKQRVVMLIQGVDGR